MAKKNKKNNKSPDFDPNDFPENFDEFIEDEFIDFDDPYSGFDEKAYWQEPDFLLSDIVHLMVNLAELEIGVTLFIKGMTVTGVLTSERNYLQNLSDTFRKRIQINRKGMSKQEQAEFDAMFDFTHLSESRIAQEIDAEDGIVMPSGSSSIRYLHLKNPIVVGAQGVMNFAQGDTPYMRLRLTMIDGWMLGEVVTPDMFVDDDDNEILH